MLTDHSYQLLETAASEALERIRADRARAPQRLKPLLAYIEDNLFDPTLDVNQLKRSCGVRDNSVPIQFHSAVGRPPHGYIEDRRLETACRLLGDTNLKIWQISELLGYSSIQVFSRAFSRWSGQRPTLFRKKARQRSIANRTGAVARSHMFFGPDSLRKALSGELGSDEAGALIERLLTIYPQGREGNNGSRSAADDSSDDTEGDPGAFRSLAVQIEGDEIDRLQAEEILKEVEQHPIERQMAMLEELRLKSPTLFHLLRRKSHRVSLADPNRGVQLAQLSLRSVDNLGRSLHDTTLLASLRTSAWAWLSHAQITHDPVGSEESLGEAERCFGRSNKSPELKADIAFARGQLCRTQQRLTEAVPLLEEARAAYAQCGLDELSTEVLVALASVQHEDGNASTAVPLLQEALAAIGDQTDGTVKLSLFLNLIAALIETGQHAEGAEILPRARQLSLAYGTSQHRIRLRWLEGSVFRHLGRFGEAEAGLLEARDAYSEIGDSVNAALVCLDLAELYSKEGRLAELTRLSSAMSPLIGDLKQHGEALAPLQHFHRAAEEQSVTRVVLEEAREALNLTRRHRAAA
jgi:AraC-like DNA-binding protein/tetratricopeptide (TPR) repeat protein